MEYLASYVLHAVRETVTKSTLQKPSAIILNCRRNTIFWWFLSRLGTKAEAPIVKLMSDLYKVMFKAEAHVNAVHEVSM